MTRAPFQALIIPFIKEQESISFAIFQRNISSGSFWQWISGGGEDNELPHEAATRETMEEAGISSFLNMYKLDSTCTIQKNIFKNNKWRDNCFVVPEHSFAVQVRNRNIIISKEHQTFKWVCYDDAMNMLKWDSNKTALWELKQRIDNNILNPISNNCKKKRINNKMIRAGNDN